MTVQRAVGVVAGLIAACLLLSGSTCDEESTTGGGTTPVARGREAPPIEGGCPDDSPTMTVDMNRDGVVDFQVIPEDGGTCRAADLNFDGVFDLFRHRDAAGNLLREEADGDFDLRLDSVAVYQSGNVDPYREEFDANWDGRIDLWVELNAACAFLRSPGAECTSECGVDWCRPRKPAATETDESSGSSETVVEETPFIAVLYRDANGDALWDTAEVLLGEHPICVAFNTNSPGDTPENVHPESVEVYKPASVALGRADIDYMRRDYLDLQGNPIVRCEDGDGAIAACPTSCAP
jgi:hypothetical protein